MCGWGLTGLYIIDDPADPATLPSGAYDLPLVIADRQFDENNQLEYYYDPAGVVGDKVLINGVYQPYLDVADRKYRLRFLNGANARIYILTLDTGDAFTQIGTESGLLPAPVARTAMEIGSGRTSGRGCRFFRKARSGDLLDGCVQGHAAA